MVGCLSFLGIKFASGEFAGESHFNVQCFVENLSNSFSQFRRPCLRHRQPPKIDRSHASTYHRTSFGVYGHPSVVTEQRRGDSRLRILFAPEGGVEQPAQESVYSCRESTSPSKSGREHPHFSTPRERSVPAGAGSRLSRPPKRLGIMAHGLHKDTRALPKYSTVVLMSTEKVRANTSSALTTAPGPVLRRPEGGKKGPLQGRDPCTGLPDMIAWTPMESGPFVNSPSGHPVRPAPGHGGISGD